MPQRIIGLDIGLHSVKAVVLESSFREATLQRFVIAKLPPPGDLLEGAPGASPEAPPEAHTGSADAQLSASEGRDAREALARAELFSRVRAALEGLAQAEQPLMADPSDIIVASASGVPTLIHPIQLPFTDPKNVARTLPFELDDLVPFELDEMVYDYVVVPAEGELLVGLLRGDDLQALLEVLSDSGLDPRNLTIDPFSWPSLAGKGFGAGSIGQPPPTPPELEEDVAPPPETPSRRPRLEGVLDLGHSATTLTLMVDGQVHLARYFPIAGQALTEAVMRARGLGYEDAEALKERSGGLLTQGVAEDTLDLAPLFEATLAPLVRSLRQTLRAFTARRQQPLDALYLSGGSARLGGLERHLGQQLSVSCLPLDPFSQVEVPMAFPSAAPALAGPALCLALGAQAKGRRFELRRGPHAYKGRAGRRRLAPLIAAVAAGLLVVAGLGGIWYRLHDLSQQEAALEAQLCALTEEVLGECIPFPDDAISRMKAEGGGQGGDDSIPAVSAGDVLAGISQRLAPLGEITLTELNIGLAKVRIEGEAGSFDGVSKVVSALESYGCLDKVTQGTTRQARGSEKIEFNIDAFLSKECARS